MQPKHRASPESIVASILFIALFFVVLIQVFGRTPLFIGPIWTEELARWLWIWMAFIGIAEVERTDGQLRMSFLVDALPAKIRMWIFTIIDLVYLGLLVNLSYIGWRTVLRTMRSESPFLPVPDSFMYASAFVAMLLVLHRVARRFYARLHDGLSKTETRP